MSPDFNGAVYAFVAAMLAGFFLHDRLNGDAAHLAEDPRVRHLR